jgi:hypothetical protein
MKRICFATILAVGCAAAQADVIDIILDSPLQAGLPGDVLLFFGTLTNLTGSPVFLNADTLSLGGFPQSSITDLFGPNAPISLDASGGPNVSSGDIELFDIAVPTSFPAGSYGGTYLLQGGSDGNAQDTLGTAGFTVQVVELAAAPEPSFRALVMLAIVLCAVTRKRGTASVRGIAQAEPRP